MDEIESLAMTPNQDDADSNGEEAWMKSILARGDRTADSNNLNVNQLSSDRLADNSNTSASKLSGGATMSSNPLSQLKARIREQNKAKKGGTVGANGSHALLSARQNSFGVPGSGLTAVNSNELLKEDLDGTASLTNTQ